MPTRICASCKEKIVIKQKDWKFYHDEVGIVCSKECLVTRIHTFYTDEPKEVFWYTESPITNLSISQYSAYSEELDILFRSHFEQRVAEYLTHQGFSIRYEPYCFEFGGQTYTPDFYIKAPYDCFIEVKGVFGVGGKKKMSEFLKNYPDINFILVPWTLQGEF